MISREHLLEMAKEFGTPLYIYQREKIESQYKKLTQAFKGSPTRFFYACKALSNINILKIVQKMGAGLDTVSLNEVKQTTMESNVVKGLYLCGEVLDIAGPVGGYNLQAAFSTGFVAGTNAAAFD